MAEKYFCGVDVGASTTKAVIISGEGEVLGRAVGLSGMDFEQAAQDCLADALFQAKIEKDAVSRTISTGYGRHNVPFAQGHKTEISCHARGAYFHFPREITVVDIGGQDNKIIHMAASGARTAFKMNRKCAAGTGAFLEEIAGRLGLPVRELDAVARQARGEVSLGSFCTVFTQTEILAKIRRGAKVPDIVKGAFRSVIKRIVEMDLLEGEVVLTGGVVANNPVIVEMFAEQLEGKVSVPPDPQCTGAFGAALFAREDSK
jgi:predicted CoA-substrate-specific enzyme activase